jgi:hypothetical protein
MTIRITCECGKALSAPDEFVGREVRCPACSRTLVLPAPAAAPIVQAAAPVPPPPPSAPPVAPPAPELRATTGPTTTPPKVAPTATSGKAIFSLVLGILGFCVPVVLSVPAIILGFMSLGAIKRSDGKIGGKGLAITGMVLGFVGSLCAIPYGLALGGWYYAANVAIPELAKTQSDNNLKQIGIALQVYHDGAGNFPSEAAPELRGLSWRVHLLPYLDESNLSSQFKYDEPWDSPTNKKLIPLMPKIYLDRRFQKPEDQSTGLTYYRAFVGPGSILGSPKPVKMLDISNADGAANTLMVVEAGEPIPWTKPEDPSFDADGPFGGPKRELFIGLYADGHTSRISSTLDPKLLRALITWDGKEAVIAP